MKNDLIRPEMGMIQANQCTYEQSNLKFIKLEWIREILAYGKQM